MRAIRIAKDVEDRDPRSCTAARIIRLLTATGRSAVRTTARAARFLAVTAPALASPTTPYAHMAPIDAYLMDRHQEIALARSAAPSSVSKDATILVLTRTGYETAASGTNGFVCWVSRSFSGSLESPERWNPKIRAAECQNPQAARSVLPIAKLVTSMVLAGRTTAETITRLRTAFSTHEIQPLESGAMSYMMSKSAYLTDQGDHDMPHVMFYVAVKNASDWGANAPDTPIIGGNYWFLTPGHETESASLPPLCIFLIGVPIWSDGTPAPRNRM